MLNYLLFYGFLYSLLSLVFPSKRQEEIEIDIEVEEDSEIEVDIQI